MDKSPLPEEETGNDSSGIRTRNPMVVKRMRCELSHTRCAYNHISLHKCTLIIHQLNDFRRHAFIELDAHSNSSARIYAVSIFARTLVPLQLHVRFQEVSRLRNKGKTKERTVRARDWNPGLSCMPFLLCVSHESKIQGKSRDIE